MKRDRDDIAEPLAVVCPRCGYDLRGQRQPRADPHPDPPPHGGGGNRCPECGLVEGSEEWWRLVRLRPFRQRFASSLLAIVIIIYAPCSWVFFIDYPWSEYHWQWIRMWLGLPGLTVFHGVGSDAVQIAAAHLFSFAVLVLASLLGARGWKWLIPIALVLALLSTWNSIGLYHAFLM